MYTILVIDDYSCIRDLLREELGSEGYRVMIAEDLSSGIDLGGSSEPDLVILDLYLEKQDRWDILIDIKTLSPKIPVIVHTAYEGYAKDERITWADGLVIKSMFLNELKTQVAEVLGRKTSTPRREAKANRSCRKTRIHL